MRHTGRVCVLGGAVQPDPLQGHLFQNRVSWHLSVLLGTIAARLMHNLKRVPKAADEGASLLPGGAQDLTLISTATLVASTAAQRQARSHRVGSRSRTTERRHRAASSRRLTAGSFTKSISYPFLRFQSSPTGRRKNDASRGIRTLDS